MKNIETRQRRLKVCALAAGLGVLLAACGGAETSSEGQGESPGQVVSPTTADAATGDPAPQGDKEPVRFGIVTSQGGPYSSIGQEVIETAEFAADYFNGLGGIDGREVEYVVIDDRGTPEGAVEGVERAILQENAPFITGVVASSQAAAVNAQIEQQDGLFVASIPASDTVTGTACSPRVFRSQTKDSMHLNTMESWLEGRDEEVWSALGADYEWGHNNVEAFVDVAESLNWNVVDTHFAPLGETDFGSYISTLQGDGADGLWVALSGSDVVNFIQQAVPYGLFDEKSVVAGAGWMADSAVRTLQADAEDLVASISYHHSLDNPENEEFVGQWMETFDVPPTNNHAQTFLAFQMMAAGIEAAGSVVPGEVAKAMNDLTLETIQGELTIRGADGDLLTPGYLGQVVEQGDDAFFDYDFEIINQVSPEVASPEPNGECTAR